MICFEYVCEGNRKADGTKKSCSTNAAPNGGVTGRGTHTHTLIESLRQRHMLDNKTIQLLGLRGRWGYSAAQANGNNNDKRGKNDAGKWVKKHFQADCSLKNQFEKLHEKKKSFSQLKGPHCAGKL